MPLNPEQATRYSRHVLLPGFGVECQEKLLNSSVLMIGAGGLGCPIALYLAGCGVGTLGVADFDVIDLANLQRQIAYKSCDVGKYKAEKLIESMRNLNPGLVYRQHQVRVDADNIIDLAEKYDLVIDGSDNFATRFLVGDAAYLQNIPLLHGAIYQYEAQIMLLVRGQTACYRCVFGGSPGTSALEPCSNAGVLGALPGVVGAMMASEAIKFLTDMETPSLGTMILYNGIEQLIRHMPLKANNQCILCGTSSSITIKTMNAEHYNDQSKNYTPCPGQSGVSISIAQAKAYLKEGARLLDVREEAEYAEDHLASAELVPLSKLSNNELQLVASPVVTLAYCRSGKRSLRAVELLRGLGFANCYSIEGGIEAWRQEPDNEPVNATV